MSFAAWLFFTVYDGEWNASWSWLLELHTFISSSLHHGNMHNVWYLLNVHDRDETLLDVKSIRCSLAAMDSQPTEKHKIMQFYYMHNHNELFYRSRLYDDLFVFQSENFPRRAIACWMGSGGWNSDRHETEKLKNQETNRPNMHIKNMKNNLPCFVGMFRRGWKGKQRREKNIA